IVKKVRAIPAAPYKMRLRRLVEASQYCSFVQGDMIGFIALDFILRLIRAGMVNVAFVGNVTAMHFDNCPTHPAGFRIPTYMIANLECLDHGSSCNARQCLISGRLRWLPNCAPEGPLNRHPVTVEFMIFIIAALTSAKVGKITDKLDCRDPFHHLEPKFIFTAQP